MKKILYIVFTGLIVFSCNLNQLTYSEVSGKDYIKDENSVNTLVMGMYNAMYGVMYYEWAVTELRSDNARMRANNSTSQETKLVEQLDQGTILTANAWVQDYWDKSYAAIYRANDVLSNLDVVENQEKRAQFEGEAKFLRAHLYFNLVRLWGPVFKVTEKLDPEEARHMQRAPKEEIYALIEEDLNAIIDGNLLPETHAAADLGRADMKAARALLAKYYMTVYQPGEDNYAKAKTLLEEVLNACGNPQSGAELVPYDDVFSIANEMNPEIIFAVRYRSGNLGLGSPFTTLFGPVNNGGNVCIGSPKQFDFPSDNLIAAYEKNEGDLRKDVVVKESYVDRVSGKSIEARWNNKFLQSDMANEYDAENDWPIIRLGDVILLYAELLNELSGPTPDAFKYLNMIRSRAGIPEYDSAQLPSKYAFRMAVREERRLELAMENQRWFDLMRWGTAVTTVNDFFSSEVFYSQYDYTVNPIAEWQVLLPIPTSVMNINPDVAQNPGY